MKGTCRKWPASRSSESEGRPSAGADGRRPVAVPSAALGKRAYETCLSAASTAVLAHGHQLRTSRKLEPPPGIAPSWLPYQRSSSLKMLWGRSDWSARDGLHVQGCLIRSQVGLLFPVNHSPGIGVPDRLRSGDLLRERQACCLDYTTGTF